MKRGDLYVTRDEMQSAIDRAIRARANELDAQKMPGTLDIPGVKDYVNATPPVPAAAPSTDAELDEAMEWLNELVSPRNFHTDHMRKNAAFILSHIRQQAERIAELEAENERDEVSDWMRACADQGEQIAALRAENERLDKAHNMALRCYSKALIDMDGIQAWRTWGKNVALPAMVSGDWKRIDAAIVSAPKDAP